jgi:hypothetical protein
MLIGFQLKTIRSDMTSLILIQTEWTRYNTIHYLRGGGSGLT